MTGSRGNVFSAVLGGVIGGILVALAFFTLAGDISFVEAKTSGAARAASDTPAFHEQMHQMMDAVHGEGTSQRMHEAIGPDAEEMMDQCAGMMAMMQDMGSMMGGDAMRTMGAKGGAMRGRMGR